MKRIGRQEEEVEDMLGIFHKRVWRNLTILTYEPTFHSVVLQKSYFKFLRKPSSDGIK